MAGALLSTGPTEKALAHCASPGAGGLVCPGERSAAGEQAHIQTVPPAPSTVPLARAADPPPPDGCGALVCASAAPATAVALLPGQPGVNVSPDGAAIAQLAAATRTTSFTVQNTGDATATFSLAPECRDAQGQRTEPCTASSPSTPALAPGSSAPVTVTYAATQAGTLVTVLLRARQTDAPGVQDAGWTDVTLQAASAAAAAPQVTLVPLNGGGTVERSVCVTVATSARTAFECGDLRIVHPLPAHYSRGRGWAPTLLYNSQHAHPRPIVYADVTVPGTPASVEMVVRMQDGAVYRAAFAGAAFAPGVARRIGVQWDALQTPTGLYRYTVEVIGHHAGGSLASQPSAGEIAIVNRAASPFGAGWWLAGVESVQCVDCATGGSRVLWVGGDGSTRVFEPAAPGAWTTWTAQTPDGPPDTLTLAGAVYTRRLRGGGEVRYDGGGRQTQTANRLGQTTRFVYGGDGTRILGIYAPGAATPGPDDPAWILDWDGAAGLVRGITATAAGAPGRTTSLGMDAARRLTAITDPGGSSAGFDYHGASNAVKRRRDGRGTYVHFAYDAAGKLSRARIQMGAAVNDAVDVATSFAAAESRGVAFQGSTGAASSSAALAYTRINGPRPDVNDLTHLWLSDSGSVRRVRDAAGGETHLQFDPRFPALPTRVERSTGPVSRAHYDMRGRVDTATVENPLGDGRDQVTTYGYGGPWDAPTAVRSYGVAGGAWTPLAGTAHAEYDSLNGNVLWRQQGEDPARRVRFFYYGPGTAAAGQPRSVHAPAGGAGEPPARDSLAYDARGNLRMAVSPLGFHTVIDRDALGRPVDTFAPVDAASALTEAGVRANGVRTHVAYDRAGRDSLSTTTGPAVVHHAPAGVRAPAASPAETVNVRTLYDAEGAPVRVTRWASPDPAGIDSLATAFTYDAAGRKRTEADGARTQTFGYDLAGSLVAWEPAAGSPAVTMGYDVLGQRVHRIVPQAEYPAACPVISVGDNGGGGKEPAEPSVAADDGPGGTAASSALSCAPFPHYGGGSGVMTIRGDTTVHRYDEAGRLVYAKNHDAVVERAYYPGGQLRDDVIRMRTYAGSDYSRHIYPLRYAYDLAGRLTHLDHPAVLTGQQRDTWTYDPVTGALATATDRRGTAFQLEHDFAGRMTSLRQSYNGIPAVVDSTRYDAEGRRVARVEYRTANGERLHEESYAHDARGKLLMVQNTLAAAVHQQWYSGLGMLAGTWWGNPHNAAYQNEEFVTDPLGNLVAQRSGSPGQLGSWFTNVYEPGVARVTFNVNGAPEMGFDPWFPEETRRTYDRRGNQDWVVREVRAQAPEEDYVGRVERSRSFYAADGQLRFYQQNDVGVGRDALGRPVQVNQGVWEEYRYDPLGRRIMVYSNRAGLCTTTGGMTCTSHITRAIWAGDQLLWELRAPGGSGADLEATGGTGGRFGWVSYFHAGGIDRPLTITKNEIVVVPHQNWRGQFARGTYPDGRISDCGPATGTNCLAMNWPGWRTNPWHQDADAPDIVTWAGSLVDGMRDESGQLYMRNRYYDPATGQFTQPDPIGLAGGLNGYGFAAGDPVSYADPYGLKVIFGGETDEERAAAREVWIDLRRRAEEARRSGNVYQRAVARDLIGLMKRAENDEKHIYTVVVGELDEEFTGGGIETTDPENSNLHLIQIDGDPQTSKIHMSPWILLAHELGGAVGWGHAIPALRAENQARTIAGCGLRIGEGTDLFPDCFRP